MNAKDVTAMNDKIELIANLYYISKLSQKEIAEKLGISRPWVSKLLARAEEMGIVKIEVNSPVAGDRGLERALAERYGLTGRVGVIPGDDEDDSFRMVCRAAAHYFISQVRPDDVIGVGWGHSVSSTIAEVVPLSLPETRVVPLAGGFGTQLDHLPNAAAAGLAHTIGGRADFIHAPAFCHSREELEALLTNPQTSAALDQAARADLHIVGMGGITDTMLIKHGILNAAEVRELLDAGAVGDVTLQFLDAKGGFIDTEIAGRILKTDLKKMGANAREIIGIACGTYKVPVIRAAFALGLPLAFFTDVRTAQALLAPEADQ